MKRELPDKEKTAQMGLKSNIIYIFLDKMTKNNG